MNNFKVGDRVRYTGKSTRMFEDKHVGDTGVVVAENFRENNVPVLWDFNNRTRGVFPENLELIKMIDTTKRLFIGADVTVTFVTETSDGNILVSVPPGTFYTEGWYIFNKQGKLVRSHNNTQASMTLKNEPEDVITYQRVVAGDDVVRSYVSSAILTETKNWQGPFVKLTTRDGKVISVELVNG